MSTRRLAIIGARGIHNYGGFETFVSEVAPRLRENGYDVLCSSRMAEEDKVQVDFKGVRVVRFPLHFPRNNKLGRMFEVLYDWYFALRFSFFERCDVVYCLGIAAGLVTPLCRLCGTKVMTNIDGVEWKREKFGFLERGYIRMSYVAAYAGADRIIIDNSRLMNHISPWARQKAVFVPYGVSPLGNPTWDHATADSYVYHSGQGLTPRGYWLVVARLEPDNRIHTIVEGYNMTAPSKPLVVVGSFSSRRYRDEVLGMARTKGHGSIEFAGAIYNKEHLDMLRYHCLAYIHGHSVGGTNPSLLEAMSAGNIIIAHSNEFNREVAGEAALYFKDAGDLAAKMDQLEGDMDSFSRLGGMARDRANKSYRWEDVVESYDRILSDL